MRERGTMVAVAVVAMALMGAACGGGGGGAGAADSPAAAEAGKIFSIRCTPCHGSDGSGNGPAAAALNPKPRDYRSKEWQGTVTDATIEKAIVGGGPAIGKSPLMPPNPDLASKPEVVTELRRIVRSFGK
jgi:hypothetical protein